MKSIFDKIKTYAFIIMGGIIIVLFALLMTDSKPVDSHKALYEFLKSDYDKAVAQNKALGDTNKVLYAKIRRLDSIERVLRGQLSIFRRDLDKSVTNAVQLAKEIKSLKPDTSEKDQKCDDLSDEVLQFSFLYTHYKGIADSLSENADSIKTSYQAANYQLQVAYDNLFASYNRMHDAYLALISDNNKLNKSLRRQKLKTKVTAILGILGTGAALIK